MAPRIAIMAGGTGGHVFPALAVAEVLRARGADVFWLGTRAGLEARLVPEQGFEIEWLSVTGIRGKGLRTLAAAPLRFAGALGEAAGILKRRAPAAVLGMGGFASGPGGIMAWRQRRPLLIQEQNSVPGMTNQWLARVADQVFEAFPNSFPVARRAITVGNPVRTEITALPPPQARLAGRSGAARLLVLGGSLGAQALNETLAQALAQLPQPLRPVVRHQAGERTLGLAQQAYTDAGIKAEVRAFITDMAEAYAWADLVICRSGALTVSELAAAGLAAILVPYPHAVDDHQVGNARWLSDVGAAQLLLQQEMNAARLASLLEPLLADPRQRLSMAEAARAKAQPNAAERIAQACLERAG
ncbi:MAG: undecaprenyldiphospho-muramoylpentapeptide beta-N-acetylglucosaminyltransferase [Lamprobacter sp.]|uniref:undecaprenyldiphospho-muramoylpentapeptide beta-N-acetylglucosaminyltransferase n=1 Tax=Lamprobacter sp. TaxID=3100796 RepID=UPI002B263159|nr:undecaprenyldiphospho-muramoylpentapeptide beta-N-acetylglucosaminyltransferase [Lamprobacter sp.]MEA3640201.1 undecaprenyldiphospho-muramoylpentapeptide beta-N-acetylglucosaminyltransferase [Lamprobacter sp.]